MLQAIQKKTSLSVAITDQKMVTSTPRIHLVDLTKIPPILLAELPGIWSLLWGGNQLKMLIFNIWTGRICHATNLNNIPCTSPVNPTNLQLKG